MPFGLHGAAASFQTLMDKVLAPHHAYAAACIDDILIFLEQWEQHLQHLQAILIELRETDLTGNLKKCSLGQKET